MDFTTFTGRETIGPLAWLGRRDWIEFTYSSFKDRTVSTRPRPLEITPEERAKYPKEHWVKVQEIVDAATFDVVNSFMIAALAKSIAGGPKIFQPNYDDCIALEHQECSMTFTDYKQPYPVIIIEIPKQYKQRLAQLYQLPTGPSHVLVHHDPEKGFVNVHAFFSRQNVLSHITPARSEYQKVEDAITLNKVKHEGQTKSEFEVAETVQRIAINFCMIMVLAGVRQTGPLEPDHYAKAKKMASRKDKHHRELGKKLLDSAMFKIEWIDQKIKLFEEEFIQPRQPRTDGEGTHASPKPHWRRGHYRHQACGVQLMVRKLVFIKPVLVMAGFYSGEIGETSVTYKLTTKEQEKKEA